MKKTLLIFFITGLTQLHAQMDFEFIALTINFENGADSIIQYSTDSSFSTHWQIGTPSKTNFNASYSADHAMVTDTLDLYHPNTLTWFEVPFIPNDYPAFFPYVCPLNICFQHQLLIDPNHAGAWIEIRDNDQTLNIAEFSFGTPLWGNSHGYFDLVTDYGYWSNDSIFNGEFGFHSDEPSWTKVCYSLSAPGLGLERTFDTLYFRFNFATDDDSLHPNEGWIIDDIEIGKGFGGCGGGLNNELNSLINIHPNPANEYFFLNSRYEFREGKMEIVNVLGEIQLYKDLEYDESIFVSLAQLNPGAYFVRLKLDGKYATKKIFIR
jgi:hypothetical protein